MVTFNRIIIISLLFFCNVNSVVYLKAKIMSFVVFHTYYIYRQCEIELVYFVTSTRGRLFLEEKSVSNQTFYKENDSIVRHRVKPRCQDVNP